MIAVGVDGWKKGWVGVVLRDGAFDRAVTAGSIADLADQAADSDVIGVDIPIGLPPMNAKSPRQCDVEARLLLKERASSVFSAPPKKLLEQRTPQIANQMSWDERDVGLPSQAYYLGRKILEVERWIDQGASAYEVHPELSFLAMNEMKALGHSKKTWGGVEERKALLEANGIVLSNLPEAVAAIPVDDVLDAAAVAWSATRIARGPGEHKTLPKDVTPGERVPTISF